MRSGIGGPMLSRVKVDCDECTPCGLRAIGLVSPRLARFLADRHPVVLQALAVPYGFGALSDLRGVAEARSFREVRVAVRTRWGLTSSCEGAFTGESCQFYLCVCVELESAKTKALSGKLRAFESQASVVG